MTHRNTEVAPPAALVPTVVVGDIHGDLAAYHSLLQREEARAGRPLPSIQVGDYGIGRMSDGEERAARRFHLAHRRHRFLRGNHDDPEAVLGMPGWIPDGALLGQVLVLGGADGGRAATRLEADTEMTAEDMAEVLVRLRSGGRDVRVVVSHDAPQHAAQRLSKESGGAESLAATRTRRFLQEVQELLRPPLWLFGHWHQPWAWQDGPTHYRCVGFHEAFTVELPCR